MSNMDNDGESLCSSSSGSDAENDGREHSTPVTKHKKNKTNKAKAAASESEANTSTSTLASHLPEDAGPSVSSTSLATETGDKKVVSFRSETSLEQIYSFDDDELPPSCWYVERPSPSPPRSFLCCCCCRRRPESPERTSEENDTSTSEDGSGDSATQ